MKQKRIRLFLSILICFSLILPAVNAQAATTITSNQTGTHDNYYYELWKDSGNTSMTLNSGGRSVPSGVTLEMHYSVKARNSTRPRHTSKLETFP